MLLRRILGAGLLLSSITVQAQAETDRVILPEAKNPYLSVPELGAGVGLLSRQQETALGEQALREIRKSLPLMQDVWLEDQVLAIFSAIYSQAGIGKPLAVVIIRDGQINAFAVPGGLFAVNSGTISQARTMDELAAVIAHEIAHVSQRHYSRSQDALRGSTAAGIAGLLLGLAIAAKEPDAGAAVMMGSQAATADRQLSYSRSQEREADRVGMQYLALAGYNPDSMADFFEYMQRMSPQISFFPSYWLTHPQTLERMSEARARAAQYPRKNQPLDVAQQQQFDLIRWRSNILYGQVDINQLLPSVEQDNAVALAVAYYFIQRAQFSRAEQILQKIRPTAVQKTLYHLTWAASYQAQKKYPQALAQVLPLYRIAPENHTLAMTVAQLYVLNQQLDEALPLLKRLSQTNPRDVRVWQLLQQATAQLPQDELTAIQALRYRAEAQFWQGEEKQALKSLLYAQRLAKNHADLQAKIHYRIEQIQQDIRQFAVD